MKTEPEKFFTVDQVTEALAVSAHTVPDHAAEGSER
jgi:hypothetical protein